mmetsp:Transcript_98836/g.255462  ORF Transcript_98836/g.255462 Transcript_98836/m.255462 type:complete len:208 (+) Transcript_98836:175-798(+)
MGAGTVGPPCNPAGTSQCAPSPLATAQRGRWRRPARRPGRRSNPWRRPATARRDLADRPSGRPWRAAPPAEAVAVGGARRQQHRRRETSRGRQNRPPSHLASALKRCGNVWRPTQRQEEAGQGWVPAAAAPSAAAAAPEPRGARGRPSLPAAALRPPHRRRLPSQHHRGRPSPPRGGRQGQRRTPLPRGARRRGRRIGEERPWLCRW